MSRLSQLIQTRAVLADAALNESNLEEGRIFVYYAGRPTANFRCNFCWCSPGNGIAEIEIWGASGSSGLMCCCGLGIPGNPGAYSKSIVQVNSSSRVNGNTGMSCGNSSTLCFRGCSLFTGVCITSLSGNFCMCAEGGRGGETRCNEGNSPLTTFESLGYCVTSINAGCGIVCNVGESLFIPQAFGGNDINCSGGFSCLFVGDCNSCCWPLHRQYLTTSAGIYNTNSSTIELTLEQANLTTGFAVDSLQQGLAGLSSSPTSGAHYRYCWAGTQYCGCREEIGCHVILPTGIPGPGATPCNEVRDHGRRGGMGAVKIKFIAS